MNKDKEVRTYKKLYKNTEKKVLTGLLAGVGDFFNIDPNIVRMIFLLFVIVTGFVPGLVIYVVIALIVPKKPNDDEKNEEE